MFYITSEQASRDINHNNMKSELIVAFPDAATKTECMEKVVSW